MQASGNSNIRTGGRQVRGGTNLMFEHPDTWGPSESWFEQRGCSNFRYLGSQALEGTSRRSQRAGRRPTGAGFRATLRPF